MEKVFGEGDDRWNSASAGCWRRCAESLSTDIIRPESGDIDGSRRHSFRHGRVFGFDDRWWAEFFFFGIIVIVVVVKIIFVVRRRVVVAHRFSIE